jgi:hypothetical protein
LKVLLDLPGELLEAAAGSFALVGEGVEQFEGALGAGGAQMREQAVDGLVASLVRAMAGECAGFGGENIHVAHGARGLAEWLEELQQVTPGMLMTGNQHAGNGFNAAGAGAQIVDIFNGRVGGETPQ